MNIKKHVFIFYKNEEYFTYFLLIILLILPQQIYKSHIFYLITQIIYFNSIFFNFSLIIEKLLFIISCYKIIYLFFIVKNNMKI